MAKKRKEIELESFGETEIEITDLKTSDSEISESEVISEEDLAMELGEFEHVDSNEIFIQDTEGDGILPEVSEEQAELVLQAEESEIDAEELVEGTELENFESAEIEELEFVEAEQLESIIESVLFASDRPVSLASLKILFKGTNIKTDKIRKALDALAVEYAGGRRGVTLEEVPGGYQLRTKIDNMQFLRRTLKARPFKLSGPALEVLAIVAYKQPIIKSEIDEIRGVESGHLLRALMEKGLCNFAGKSDLPGKPMQYGTTRKFLEIFGLRNLSELPTLSQIDELLPEGIGEEEQEAKPTLSQLTDKLSENVGMSYSQGEEELGKITEALEVITTSSDFFEQEKLRQKQKRDLEKAQNIREALAIGESVSNRDINWLKRYDEALAAGQENPVVSQSADTEAGKSDSNEVELSEADSLEINVTDLAENVELAQAVAEFDSEDDENHVDDAFLNDYHAEDLSDDEEDQDKDPEASL